jgi:hypothetical protein
MAASEELLGLLHDAVASKLLAKVQSGEASPAEMSAAIKFLKDNGIEAIPTPSNHLGQLAKSLPDFDTEDEKLHARH